MLLTWRRSRLARLMLALLSSLALVVAGLVPAEAVAPLGNSTFLAQTQTQNLGGINGALTSANMAQSVSLNGSVYYIGVGPTTGAELYSTDGTTPGTNLVKDLYSGSSGYSTGLAVSNGKLYYQSIQSSGTSAGSYEPFISDGTGGGTALLKDVNPSGSSSPTQFTQGPSGLTYFVATDETTSTYANGTSYSNGAELWVTDGTAGNTKKVKDLNTYSYFYTPNSSYYSMSSSIANLTSCNGLMFFTANEQHYYNYQELWVTDGTTAGTRMVKDINTTTYTTPYAAYSSSLNVSVPAGTTLTVGSSPTSLTCVGTTLFFSADDGTGRKLWKSDGTSANTAIVRGSSDGSFPVNPYNYYAFGTKLIFTATANSYGTPSTNYGDELWISDGTVAGTTLLKDINPNSGSSSPSKFILYNGQIYFTAYDYRGTELWKTDGTNVGTLLVKDINVTASGSSSTPNYFYVWDNKLFFTADDGTIGRELYVTLGSGVTTILVKDVFPGISDLLDISNISSNQPYFAGTTNALIFVANSPIYGQEMWKTDGTSAGTTLLQDLNTNPGSAYAHDEIAFNGKIYFAAASAYYGEELWSTDLTTGNTSMVIDIYPGASSGMDTTNSYFVIFNGKLFFTARNATTGWELWSTDGTAAGTAVAADVYPGYGLNGSSYWPAYLTVCNGKLFYAEYTGLYTLVAYDGTSSSIVYNNHLFPSNLVCLNNTLYFSGQNYSTSPLYDTEVWKSNGTQAGTVVFFDAYTGAAANGYGNSSYPSNLTVYNNKLYFTANNLTSGTELYVTDGAATPTLIDIFSGASSSSPSYLRVYKGELWFRANNGSNGNDLMSYDGTTLTTRDLVAGGGSYTIDTNVVIAGNLLWFRGYLGASGYELWSSDGTAANTGLFEDLSPNSASTTITSLTAVGGVIMYNTYDSIMGSQPRFVVVSSVNTVTFSANGATSGSPPADVSVMSISATVPGNTGALDRTGYSFVGWNTNALGTGTSYLPGSTITPIVDTPLFAMWSSVTTYTITYNANNATSGVVAPPLTGVSSMVTLDTNSGVLARTGYSFAGWNTNAAGTGTSYASGSRFTPVADTTLYAKWTALTAYTISFQLNGATGTVPSTINTYATATVTLPGQGSMTAPAGKTFSGWNTNAAGSGTAFAAAETLSPQSSLVLYAQWTATPSSTLTYNANGSTSGAVPAALTAAGTYVVVDSNTGNLAKTGFVFSGWNTAADGSGTTYQGTDNYLLSANVTLYAKWVAASYTVTFNANGATSGSVPAAVTGVAISTTLPGNTGTLAKPGYTFGGWNTLASGLGTNYSTGATYSPTSDSTLYAKWTALPTYTITYNANGATGGGAPVAQSGVYSSVTLDNNSGSLVKAGSYFAGWNTAADGSGTSYAAGSSFTPVANITMYALWSNVVTYTVSYLGNSNTSGTAPLPQTGITSTATVSGNTGLLSRLGYRFDGWNTAANGSGTAYAAGATITPVADTNLYAQWVSVPTFTITFNGNSQTSGSIPSSITSSDASVALPGNTGVLNKTNYTFNGWNTNTAGTGTHYDVGASFALSANVTLYAEWLANSYTLTYNANGADSGTVPNPTTGRGALTTATNSGSLAKAGYTFGGWNTAADGTGTTVAVSASYTPTQNTTLFAKWNALPVYTITYNGNGSTGGSVPSATSSYASQTVASDGTMVRSSYLFMGWNTAANGSGTNYAPGATYSAAASVTLYAKWSAVYDLTYSGNSNDSGSAPSAVTGIVTATVAAQNGLGRTGYTFNGWNTAANGSGTAYAAGATINLVANTTLYAQWSLIPTYTITYLDNGSTGGSAPMGASGILSTATIETNLGALAKTGFSFNGWNTAANGSGTSYAPGASVTLSANLTLYAQWSPLWILTYSGNSNDSGSAPAAVNYVLSSTVAAGTGLSRTGYTFNGWNTAANGSGTSFAPAATINLSADTTLYAQWSLIPTYTLTYLGNGATSGSAPTAATGILSTATLAANSGVLVKDGFTFVGWNTAADGTGSAYLQGAQVTLTSNLTVYAQWILAAPIRPAFVLVSFSRSRLDLTGGLVTVSGEDLKNVQTVSMDGLPLTFSANTSSQMNLAMPAHSAGFVNLTLTGKGLKLTYLNAVEYVAPVVASLNVVISKSGNLTASSLLAIQTAISRGRKFSSISISFGSSATATSPMTALKLKDNLVLLKLATKLSQLFGRTISIAVKSTGNIAQIEVTFADS